MVCRGVASVREGLLVCGNVGGMYCGGWHQLYGGPIKDESGNDGGGVNLVKSVKLACHALYSTHVRTRYLQGIRFKGDRRFKAGCFAW